MLLWEVVVIPLLLISSRFHLGPTLGGTGALLGRVLVALRALYPQISPGGFVIIDDYNAVTACHKAVDDFRASENINQEISKIDRSGIYWRK